MLFLHSDPAGGGGDEGDGGEGGGTQVTPPAGEEGKQFDRTKLHPALRDMAPEEITELFETMAGTLRTVQSRPTGGQGLLDTSGVPAHARTPEPPAKPTPLSKDKYKELLDPSSEAFDPETAFRAFAQQNYGDLVGDINARSIRGLYGTFRTEFPDFKDYEADVTTALQGRDPALLTERDVLNTYLAAKGLRVTLKERQDRGKQSATTLPPTAPASPDLKKEIELSDLEVEVANKMFRRIKDPTARIAEYKKFAARDDGGSMTVRVPVGGGKAE
jgi:hypothetical protein